MGGNRELAERFIASLEARDWDAWAGLLHPDVVYELPQSRERIRGRDRYLRFNQEYPGDWHLRPKVTIADERHGVVWFEWLLDGRTDDAMAFFEFADGLITRVTDFWPEPYEPPPGREHLVERWLPGGLDVRLGGGPTTINEFLRADLVDYLHVVQVPVVLGRGIRLWDDLEGLHERYALETVTVPSGATHLFFTR